MGNGRFPTFCARIIMVIVDGMSIACHLREGGEVFFAKRLRSRSESIAYLEVVKITLRQLLTLLLVVLCCIFKAPCSLDITSTSKKASG